MSMDFATTDPDLRLVVKRHPIRGAIYGLLFGLGIALILIGQKVIAFGTLPPIIITVAGLVAGLVWSIFGPVKGPPASNAIPATPAMPVTQVVPISAEPPPPPPAPPAPPPPPPPPLPPSSPGGSDSS